MIVTFRKKELLNPEKPFSRDNLSYNLQEYYDRAHEIYYTELDEGGAHPDMEKIR